ncbi:MAG: hypothetical protein ACRC42_00140 [Mycoplasma sp.]
MRFNLKKFINKNNLIIISIVSVLMLSTLLGLILSVQQGFSANEVISGTKMQYEKYFKSRYVNSKEMINRQVIWSKYYIEILDYLTDWRDTSSSTYKFKFYSIRDNILTFVKHVLQTEFKYSAENYINIKYKLLDDYKLQLDIRWANLEKIELSQQTNLYWTNTTLMINN